MLRVVLLAALLSTAAAAVGRNSTNFKVEYKLPSGGGSTVMNVTASFLDNTLHSCNGGNEQFEGVEMLEDYDVGFGATRVVAQEVCYVHKLQRATLKEQVHHLTASATVDVKPTPVDLITLPVENPEEFGDRIVAFCNELPIQKIGTFDESEEREDDRALAEQDEEERCIFLPFLNCVIVLFMPICITTNLSFPTGATVTFVWFFG